MSVSKWAYEPEKCDGQPCPGDCDNCSLAVEITLRPAGVRLLYICDRRRCGWKCHKECRYTSDPEHALDPRYKPENFRTFGADTHTLWQIRAEVKMGQEAEE